MCYQQRRLLHKCSSPCVCLLSITYIHASCLVADAPRITLTPDSMVTVLNFTDIVLDCMASGEPPPTIVWTHNNEPVVSEPRVKVLANGSLAIKMLTMSDNGLYVCTAENPLGTARSDSALLMVECMYIILIH